MCPSLASLGGHANFHSFSSANAVIVIDVPGVGVLPSQHALSVHYLAQRNIANETKM